MATSKLLKPTNVTISIPAGTDIPDQSVSSNCIDKEGDAINALSDQIANLKNNGANVIEFSEINSNLTINNSYKHVYNYGHVAFAFIKISVSSSISAWNILFKMTNLKSLLNNYNVMTQENIQLSLSSNGTVSTASNISAGDHVLWFAYLI